MSCWLIGNKYCYFDVSIIIMLANPVDVCYFVLIFLILHTYSFFFWETFYYFCSTKLWWNKKKYKIIMTFIMSWDKSWYFWCDWEICWDLDWGQFDWGWYCLLWWCWELCLNGNLYYCFSMELIIFCLFISHSSS